VDVTKLITQFEGLPEAVEFAAELVADKVKKKKLPLEKENREGSRSPIPVIGLTVSPMMRVAGDQAVPIEPHEYQHNKNHLPSRNIRLSFSGESVNLGVVEAVPPMDKKGGQPPAGPRYVDDDKKKKVLTNQKIKQDILCYRDPRLFCQWPATANTGLLLLNARHPWVQKYFRLQGAPDKVANLSRELYWMLHFSAKRLVEACEFASVTLGDKTVLYAFDQNGEESKLYDDDACDYLLNHSIGQATGDPLLRGLTKQLDKEWGKEEERRASFNDDAAAEVEIVDEDEDDDDDDDGDIEVEVVAIDPQRE